MSGNEWDEALIKAADRQDTAALRQALENNADINTKTADGFTPVIIAAFRNHFEILDILVEKGAELNHMTARGSSALSLALYHMPHSADAQKCLDRLLEAGADPSCDSSLEIAADKGMTAYVERFIAAGADANKGIPLIPAAIGGHTDILRILIAADADVNAKRANGETALSYAVMNGRADCAKLLIAAGANIHVKNNENETILHRAVHGGRNFQNFEADFFDGIDKNAQNNRGLTALMEAAHRGHEDIVVSLLEAGAKTDITSNSGQTALSLAQQANHEHCIRRLIAAGADTALLSDDNKEKFAKDISAYQYKIQQDARRKQQQALRRFIRKK
ncbi:MAG: hypothetical protein HND56_01420 [Pseudomonadota bacterium]|nr:hypothetical protein [Pseudomonadota bacterium]QKK04423.1 MAG: hypothetical protein HND56_01420 [Pseudomonadota bacterium]